jgi:uncharacterized protein YutE (UPF0331/DUF86 family)
VERVLEVRGEALNQLYRIAPAVAEKIPHARDIIGFRNILAHGYAELDHTKVYADIERASEMAKTWKE